MSCKPNIFFVSFISFLSYFTVYCLGDGDSCELKDGSRGTCMKLSTCTSAYKEIRSLKFPTICTFHIWNPSVCCLDCSNITSQDVSFNYLVEGYNEANERCLEEFYKPYPCNKIGGEFDQLDDTVLCDENPSQGLSVSSPIVSGGIDAVRAEYPHMALIGYGNDRDTAEWMCGGSVISPKFILTAAHCISSPQLGEIKYAALGVLARSEDRFSWQIYDIAKIIVYPNYKPPSKYHDIALLGTAARIRYNREVVPACLNRRDTLPRIATVTGWGKLGHRKPLADVLQTVAVYKYTDAECSEAFPNHRHLKNGFDPQTQACYGDEAHESDTCEGDSGGPLQVKNKDPNEIKKCFYTIYGVTSYGKACGYVGSSGMYTKVSAYIPWIEGITGRLI